MSAESSISSLMGSRDFLLGNGLNRASNGSTGTDIPENTAQSAAPQSSLPDNNNTQNLENETASSGHQETNGIQDRRTQVRSNIYRAFNSSSRGTKLFIFFYCGLIIVEIVIGVTMLALSIKNGETCSNPLQVYLAVYVIRICVLLPLQIAHYIRRSAIHAAQERQQENLQDNPNIPPVNIAHEKIRNFLEIFGTLWFAIGNWWLFTGDRCFETAPFQFYTTLAFILLGYIVILFPVCLITSIVFCLPFVVAVLRAIYRVTGVNLVAGFTGGGVTGLGNGIGGIGVAHQGATEEAIEKIPTRLYRASKENVPSSTDNSSIYSISPEDAQCTICLVEYEDGAKIKKLPCDHHFHADCIDEWLRLNKTCPLCVRDIDESSS